MSGSKFEISTDRSRLNITAIQDFLNKDSYWAKDRTIEQTKTAIENSICFGVYNGEDLIAFGRVVSDKATFAYIGDVFVDKRFRGKGISKMLIKAMIDHPELQDLRRWILATADAHSLYEKFGFKELLHPERWMERPAPNAY